MMNRIISEDAINIIENNLPFDKFYGKTVLISGANGYVPAYFVHTFIALNKYKDAGIRILALCRNQERAENRFPEYIERDDFEIIVVEAV